MQHTDQADVQPHVAIEYVAELVGHHALKLVPIQQLDAPSGHTNDRVARRETGGEGIDGAFALH